MDIAGNGGKVSLGGVQRTVGNLKWPGQEGSDLRGPLRLVETRP